MRFLERFGIGHREEEQGQLLQILDKIKADPKIYPEIIKQLAERKPNKFKSVREAERFMESAITDADALGVAKLIDQTLGVGTYRTLGFLDKQQDSAKSVFKLLKHNIEGVSFEKQVEKGLYLGTLESYGVQWDLEKTSRDALQNFFDANGQSLDGVEIKTTLEETEESGGEKKKVGRVRIVGGQDYDWRELVHIGGTTKEDSSTAVGGFGEGLKVSAFILLKNQGATQVRAGSRDWQLDYYFDTLAADAYRKEVKGFHAKKRNVEAQQGNYLEVIFEGDDADKKVKAFEQARKLFYSKDNPDFQEASYDNKATGGFKVLAMDPKSTYRHQYGHLYLAGQRTHYDNRDKWETVEDVNIWTWKKVQPKDRDRGMITRSELTGDVMPLIVESMSRENLVKSVYDFKPLWDKFSPPSPGDGLLGKIVDSLEKQNLKLEFEKEYVANDLPWGAHWIADGLKAKGFKLCRSYMSKVGMKGAIEQFKEWQSHDRVEATPEEAKKIAVLQKASQMLGLPEDELKEVWLFSADKENSIVEGQYNSMFYWMSQEVFKRPFSDALHTYVHEAAHKEGPHGNAKFDYALQDRIQRIHRFILEHKDEWAELEKEWVQTANT